MSVHRWSVDCGSGELRALSGDSGSAGGWVDDLDPDAWAWLPGVDYEAGWREARQAADEVNALLLACGVASSELRAVATTDAQGQGWVQLLGPVQGWQALERILQLASTVSPDSSRLAKDSSRGPASWA